VDDDCISCDIDVPDDHASVQAAISASVHGETICLQPDTYAGTIDFGGKAVTVVGLAGATATAIDGGGAGPVVAFDQGEGASSVLRGVTVTGGAAAYGAGILVEQSSPTLVDLVISGNAASGRGGGVYLDMASPTLEGLLITGNSATGDSAQGGGLSASNYSSPELFDVVIEDNEVSGYWGAGAGVAVEYSWFDMTGGAFRDNAPVSGGSTVVGGVLWSEQGTIVLEGVVRSGNQALSTQAGGAIDVTYSTLELVSSRISGSSSRDGGGINATGSTVELTNTAVVNNQASNDGGGFYLESGSELTLVNSVVAGNSASSAGGGIPLRGSHVNAVNTVLADNMAGWHGGGLYVGPIAGGTIDFEWCAVWWNLPDHFYDVTDPTNTNGNIPGEPEFLDVAGADAEFWDLHLDPDSDLVDAGDPSVLDPDFSPSDIGIYGGPEAGGFDLDGDGWFEWWQPGPYDTTSYPALDLDCDDHDSAVVPADDC